MREVKIEVIGSDPPCPRCKKTLENVEKVTSKLGIRTNITYLSAASREIIEKYGILVAPALTINGAVKIIGRIPSEEEVEKILREVAK
ncbi:MAG: thioredoxin family protein [Candidatus Bathyarchaeia archaeon]